MASIECTTEPGIVKFAFSDLTIDKDKWTAKCRICKSVLSENEEQHLHLLDMGFSGISCLS